MVAVQERHHFWRRLFSGAHPGSFPVRARRPRAYASVPESFRMEVIYASINSLLDTESLESLLWRSVRRRDLRGRIAFTSAILIENQLAFYQSLWHDGRS